METNHHHQLLNHVFANPDLADETAVAQLTEQFPYVNALWFIRARLAIIHKKGNADLHIQKAALLSPKPDQLVYYLHRPPSDNNLALSEQETPLDENPWENAKDDYIEDIYLEEEPALVNESNSTLISLEDTKEKHVLSEENHTSPSRYNDDKMPYTFLWWLQKTRADYSATYQPYVKLNESPPTRKKISSSKGGLLDQQIRENIFHLQSPEQKLSTPFQGETIPFQVPNKKENPIIDRFIKEAPQISPPSPEKINLENKAKQSAEDDSGFVSETLAIIYAEQGLYHKAMETYKKLSLKFPEKSPYFADRIKELTNKIN